MQKVSVHPAGGSPRQSHDSSCRYPKDRPLIWQTSMVAYHFKAVEYMRGRNLSRMRADQSAEDFLHTSGVVSAADRNPASNLSMASRTTGSRKADRRMRNCILFSHNMAGTMNLIQVNEYRGDTWPRPAAIASLILFPDGGRISPYGFVQHFIACSQVVIIII